MSKMCEFHRASIPSYIVTFLAVGNEKSINFFIPYIRAMGRHQKTSIRNLQELSGHILGKRVPAVTLLALKANRFIGNSVPNVFCPIDVLKDW